MDALKYIFIFVLSLAAGNPVADESGSLRWVKASFDNLSVHDNMVEVGTTSDWDSIYAGRAHFNGDLLPANIIPAKRKCSVTYGGKEHEVDEFEVLVQPKLTWRAAANGEVPSGAVEAGITSGGEKLYLGNVMLAGSLILGKIHPSMECMYYPFNGEEKITKTYFSLVLEQ